MQQTPAFHLLLMEIKSQETPWLSKSLPYIYSAICGPRQMAE